MPDAKWQAAHLVLSPSTILRPEDHWQLSSEVVAVTAVVHLLDLAAPAEVGAMHATWHLMAQSARIDLHAAHHAWRKPLVAAATSSHCQVTARHDGRADIADVMEARSCKFVYKILKLFDRCGKRIHVPTYPHRMTL